MSEKKEEKKEDTKEDKKAKKKSGTPFSVKIAFVVVALAALVFLPATIVFSVCMIPTLVAAVTDSHPEKTAWLTVGALNLAGTVPVLFNLFNMWDTKDRLFIALQLISDSQTYVVAYGGAAAGWVVFNSVTSFVASVIVGKNQKRLKDIDRRQKELVRKWGADLTAN